MPRSSLSPSSTQTAWSGQPWRMIEHGAVQVPVAPCSRQLPRHSCEPAHEAPIGSRLAFGTELNRNERSEQTQLLDSSDLDGRPTTKIGEVMLSRAGSRAGRLIAMSLIPAFAAVSCTALEKLKVCGRVPGEIRINQRGDNDEYFDHPRAAAVLENGRILTAFVSASDQTSEVRVAVLTADGVALSACGAGTNTIGERVVSDPAKIAYGATVAPAHAQAARATFSQAMAVAAWVEGGLNNHQLQFRFLDEAGCDVFSDSLSYFADELGPTDSAQLFFSPSAQRSLLIFGGARGVFAAWLDIQGTPIPMQLASATKVQALTAAMDDWGRILLAWADSPTATDILARHIEVRGLLVDESLTPRSTVAGQQSAEPFVLAFPQTERGETLIPTLAATYAKGRFAVALQASSAHEATNQVSLIEIDSESGSVLGEPFGPPMEAGGEQLSPTVGYLGTGPLFLAWMSSNGGGTMGVVFDQDRQITFGAVSCDATPFPLGARSPKPTLGAPSLLLRGETQWVLHAGVSPMDSRGTAALASAWPVAWLWPGRGYGR